jgi:hypothetical protein
VLRAPNQMQKISSYLYPNRINVVADLALFPTRWNIVYQNRVKIYQGVDNVLTVDVKNTDQKRIDISDLDIRMIVMDSNGQLVTSASVIPSETQGLATVNIPATDLIYVDPQFLNYSLYIVNEDETNTVLYADTQFGAKGNMELVGNLFDTPVTPRYITNFKPITDPAVLDTPPFTIRYHSDAVDLTQPNFIRSSELDQVSFEFTLTGLTGEVVVQFTKDPVISTATNWKTVETFTVASSTATLTKLYDSQTGYDRETTWAKIYYTPAENNTGTVDRIVIKM